MLVFRWNNAYERWWGGRTELGLLLMHCKNLGGQFCTWVAPEVRAVQRQAQGIRCRGCRGCRVWNSRLGAWGWGFMAQAVPGRFQGCRRCRGFRRSLRGLRFRVQGVQGFGLNALGYRMQGLRIPNQRRGSRCRVTRTLEGTLVLHGVVHAQVLTDRPRRCPSPGSTPTDVTGQR
jgi:hypothetical protein